MDKKPISRRGNEENLWREIQRISNFKTDTILFLLILYRTNVSVKDKEGEGEKEIFGSRNEVIA